MKALEEAKTIFNHALISYKHQLECKVTFHNTQIPLINKLLIEINKAKSIAELAEVTNQKAYHENSPIHGIIRDCMIECTGDDLTQLAEKAEKTAEELNRIDGNGSYRYNRHSDPVQSIVYEARYQDILTSLKKRA